MGKSEPPPVHRSFRLTPDSTSRDVGSVGSLREAFKFALVQQAILIGVSALLLDGGEVFRRVLIATIAHWCFFAIFLTRCKNDPTAIDVLFVKYGIWALVIATGVIARMFGRL